jgi:hypothetical protein
MLVPEPSKPQSLNRYSWVLGNPLRYVDPSGHIYFDYEKGVMVWNGIPWLEASQNAPEGFDLMAYPEPDPGIQVRPNLAEDGTLADDGSYIVSSPDDPTFIYPTEVAGTARVLRAEVGGENAVPGGKREEASSSVVWVMRNMVEKGRLWADGRGRTEYPTYSTTWSQFAEGSEGLLQDEIIALRVFLGQVSDPTGGGVYMINHQCWLAKPEDIQEKQTGAVTWRIGKTEYGHHFYTICTGFCP